MAETPTNSAGKPALDNHDPSTLPSNAMLTVRETCAYLRISKWTLYRLIASGQIKSVKLGSRRLFRRDTLLKVIEQLENREG
jgi:excisionase family DNA binding protein